MMMTEAQMRAEFNRQPASKPFQDWGIGNIIDPFGALRTIQAGGNPLDSDPFDKLDPGGNPYASDAQINQVLQSIANSSLSPEERSFLIQAIKDDPQNMMQYYSLFDSQRVNAENRAIAEGEKQRVQQLQAGNQERLSTLERSIRPQIQSDIRRYSADGSTLRKNFINTDSEFSTALSGADAVFNAQVNSARQQARAANASAGVMSSGKTSSAVGQAESAGATGKANVRNDLYGRAREGLGYAREGLRDFDSSMVDARNQIDQGLSPEFSNIADKFRRGPTDYYSPRATGIDERYGQTGIDLSKWGLAANTATSLFNTAQNGANQVTGLFKLGR